MYYLRCSHKNKCTFLIALTEHHLKYLLEDTFDVQTKWYFIGLCLGLPSSTLDAMRGEINENYTEVLKQWLKIGEEEVD